MVDEDRCCGMMHHTMRITQEERLRDYPLNAETTVTKGPFSFDTKTGMTQLPDGKKVLLTPSMRRAFNTLQVGIPTPGDEIFTALITDDETRLPDPSRIFDVNGYSLVTVTISQLRVVLGDQKRAQIISERDLGWMIAPGEEE